MVVEKTLRSNIQSSQLFVELIDAQSGKMASSGNSHCHFLGLLRNASVVELSIQSAMNSGFVWLSQPSIKHL